MSPASLRKRTQLEAAALLADGRMSIPEVANKVGVSEKTIDRWAKLPTFQEAKRKILDEAERRIMSTGIASKVRRVQAMNRRWEQMTELIAARAADPAMAAVPGGSTGVLVRQIKSIGFGEKNQLVEEYAFDAALLRELREIEKHAALEFGQYGGTAGDGNGGGPVPPSGPPTKVTFTWESSDSSSGTTNSPASADSTTPARSSKATAAP